MKAKVRTKINLVMSLAQATNLHHELFNLSVPNSNLQELQEQLKKIISR